MKVPKRLVEEIVQGRCVAFVGAGFSQPVVPTWVELLRKLNGERVRSPAAHKLLRKKPPSGFDLETAADLIRATYQEGTSRWAPPRSSERCTMRYATGSPTLPAR